MVKDLPAVVPKKKAKTESSPEEVDIYKKVIDFEDKESAERTTAQDAEIYFESCKNIRTLLGEIFESKIAETTNQTEVKAKCTEACVTVAVLKKINRLVKFRIIASREQLAVEKQKVDSTHLQYQNLLYEMAHLISEWNKCKQFKSKDEDIELVTVPEFYKDAAESITKPLQEIKDTDTYSHNLHLAMLEHELSQRKELSKLCETLDDKKKQLAADIVKKRERLDSLGPQLSVVLEATKPLQENLGLPIDKTRTEYKLASMLADSLYMLYCNASSYNQVYKSGIELDIIGDQDLAQQWADAQINSENNDLDNSDQEKEQQDEREVKKRRHRKASSSADKQEVRKKQLLEAHPLAVQITIKTNGPTMQVLFQYRPHLQIVTVTCDVIIPDTISGQSAREVLAGDHLLNELYHEDSGASSPNPNTHYQLNKVGYGSYRSLLATLGYAYVWAQNMCGLEFPQTTKKQNSELSLTSVEEVINALKNRLKARTKLAQQLQELDVNIIPQLPEQLLYPKISTVNLTKWSPLTFQNFCLENDTALGLLEAEIINQHDLYYSMTISRRKASLHGSIIIDNSYPKKLPIFLLKVQINGNIFKPSNCEDIRDLERAVNVECLETLDSITNVHALTLQIHYLCAYFDVFLETNEDNPNTDQNAVYFKRISGRNRRKPFRYRKVGSGIYTQ